MYFLLEEITQYMKSEVVSVIRGIQVTVQGYIGNVPNMVIQTFPDSLLDKGVPFEGWSEGRKCSRATYTFFMPVSQKEVAGTKAVGSGEEG